MTRTVAREIAVHLVFELGFSDLDAGHLLEEALTEETFALIGAEEPLYAEFPDEKQETYIRTLVEGVYEHKPELDEHIAHYAVGWNLNRIPRVAAAVMRVAMYEVLYMPEIPDAAAINEAVEIAKGYEPAEVVSFVNGILGSFVRGQSSEEKESEER